MQQININSNLLVAQRRSNGKGYTWTLPSRLGEMLNMAEELFGKRDRSYTILGIEFGPDNPRIWYPSDNRRCVIIQLGLRAATDMSRACYQMAHETVHLLAPSGTRNATNFEEGVACYFAAYYMKEKFNEPYWRPDLPSYERALALVKPRLDEDKSCVHRLRELHPSFQDMTEENICKEFPKLISEDVHFLVSKFKRDSDR